jgi:hypothetical protein
MQAVLTPKCGQPGADLIGRELRSLIRSDVIGQPAVGHQPGKDIEDDVAGEPGRDGRQRISRPVRSWRFLLRSMSCYYHVSNRTAVCYLPEADVEGR